MIGQIVEVRVVQLLGNYGLEFEIPSPNRPKTNIMDGNMSRKEPICG